MKMSSSGCYIKDNSYDLSRDLRVALSEYAPDSEVIVDKKKYTSKYISLPKTSGFLRHYFCTSPNCKKVNVYISDRKEMILVDNVDDRQFLCELVESMREELPEKKKKNIH